MDDAQAGASLITAPPYFKRRWCRSCRPGAVPYPRPPVRLLVTVDRAFGAQDSLSARLSPALGPALGTLSGGKGDATRGQALPVATAWGGLS